MTSASPEIVHVALGSNLGDRREAIDGAVRAIQALAGCRLRALGPVIESVALLPAEDPTPQPPYLNTVVELEVALSPEALLSALQGVERALGRTPAPRWAPRRVDLDVILWGARVVDSPRLRVPHPELHHRRFVLEPLAALAPDAVHPLLGRTVRELLRALG